MSKLYLVRRGLDTFVGPMTLPELRATYGKMAIGLQDEISSHLGPWVTLEKIDALRRYYPEVAPIIHQDMASSWGGGDQMTRMLPSATAGNHAAAAKSRNLSLAFAFFFMAAAAALVAFYLARTSKLNGKLFFMEETDPAIVAVQTAWSTSDDEFSQTMQTHFRTVFAKVLRSKSALNSWLPWYRAWAYRNEGEVEGLAGTALRGIPAYAPQSLPQDCTLRYWAKKWSLAQDGLLALASGRMPPKGHWVTFLFWDSHWVRRRHQQGWVWPKNPHEACFQMASKAWSASYGPNAAAVVPPTGIDSTEWRALLYVVERRIAVMRSLMAARSIEDADQLGRNFYAAAKDIPRDGLTLLNCFETAITREQLELCQTASKEMARDGKAGNWGSYLDGRYRLSLLRLMLRDGAGQDPTKTAEEALTGESLLLDSVTGFEYKPELQVLRIIRKNGGQIEGAINQLRDQFPDIYFRDLSARVP